MNDYKAKQAARASAAAALQAAFPYLIPISAKVDGLQAAAKNIRIELARAFPGIKFSVKSRRFSMGDAIDVRWIDGPVCKQVDDIIDRYSAGSFDGSDDSYNYSRSAWTDAFGDAKYVHSARDYSDRAVESGIRTVFSRYGFDGAAKPSAADFNAGRCYGVYPEGSAGNCDLQSLINQILSGRTWAIAKVPFAPPMWWAEALAA